MAEVAGSQVGGVGFGGTFLGQGHTGAGGRIGGGGMPFFLRHRRAADPKGQQEIGGERKKGREASESSGKCSSKPQQLGLERGALDKASLPLRLLSCHLNLSMQCLVTFFIVFGVDSRHNFVSGERVFFLMAC